MFFINHKGKSSNLAHSGVWAPLPVSSTNWPATVAFLTEYLTYVYHDQKRITAASSSVSHYRLFGGIFRSYWIRLSMIWNWLWRSRRVLSAEVGNTFQDLHNSLHEVKNIEKFQKGSLSPSERFQNFADILNKWMLYQTRFQQEFHWKKWNLVYVPFIKHFRKFCLVTFFWREPFLLTNQF